MEVKAATCVPMLMGEIIWNILEKVIMLLKGETIWVSNYSSSQFFLLFVLIFHLIIYESNVRGKSTPKGRVAIVSNLSKFLLNVVWLITKLPRNEQSVGPIALKLQIFYERLMMRVCSQQVFTFSFIISALNPKWIVLNKYEYVKEYKQILFCWLFCISMLQCIV